MTGSSSRVGENKPVLAPLPLSLEVALYLRDSANWALLLPL